MAKVRETKQNTPAKVIKFPTWKRWAALAACCAVAVGLWTFRGRKGDQTSLQAAITTDLPYTAADEAEGAAEDLEDGIALLQDSGGEIPIGFDRNSAAEPEEDVSEAYYQNVTRDAAPDQYKTETAKESGKSQEQAAEDVPALAPEPAQNSAQMAGGFTSPTPTAPAPTGSSGQITAEDAKAAALAHAGLTASEVTFTQAKLDWEDGKQVYDVEFHTASGAEYDYEIDAATGAVVKFDYDAESYTPPAPTVTTITAEDARAAALAHAGLTAGEVTFTQTELDHDDGKQIYEIEFYTPAAAYDSAQRTEYEYEIDAASGAVLKFDSELKNSGYAPVDNPQAAILTREAVQELALAQVPGAAAENITKLKQDRDDGREIYEIEIIYNGKEYEMELDAYTGAVLSFEAESTRH